MKRIFWGLVKIAIIVGLLVWAVREIFPVSDETSILTKSATEEQTAEKIETIFEKEGEKEIPLVTRSSEPSTLQQRKYVSYSEKSGMPEIFTTLLKFKGTEPLSIQIARALGEPTEDWKNFSAHSKTFWVLAELTLYDINVDAASTLNGLSITVRKGNVWIDTSEISTVSLLVPTVISSTTIVFEGVSLDTGELDSPFPSPKRMRRMSARSWQQVIEAGTRGRMFQKR